MDRFDLRADGTYRGCEDFCVLNARRTDEKYRGSYEGSVLRRFEQFAASSELPGDLEKLYTLIALNCALRNGDAHLKNFAIVYEEVWGEARLAPVFDLITTAVYLPADKMALTLNGTTRWPDAQALERLGTTRAQCAPAKARQILQRIADALADTAREVRAYIKEHAEFREVGAAMLSAWRSGQAHSLQ